jgi:hypothetical protein
LACKLVVNVQTLCIGSHKFLRNLNLLTLDFHDWYKYFKKCSWIASIPTNVYLIMRHDKKIKKAVEIQDSRQGMKIHINIFPIKHCLIF